MAAVETLPHHLPLDPSLHDGPENSLIPKFGVSQFRDIFIVCHDYNDLFYIPDLGQVAHVILAMPDSKTNRPACFPSMCMGTLFKKWASWTLDPTTLDHWGTVDAHCENL